MKKTKRKILDAAITLFNEHGIPSIKLKHIAKHCGISVGNLAYHFPLKEDLLVFVTVYIASDIDSFIRDKKVAPYLIDFSTQLSLYYRLINQYAFYFLDVFELKDKYQHIHEKRCFYNELMIDQIYGWLQEQESSGLLQPELQDGQYRRLAVSIWMTIIFWMTQKKIRPSEESEEEEFKLVVWTQILPSFTDIGRMEYEALIAPQLDVYQPSLSETIVHS